MSPIIFLIGGIVVVLLIVLVVALITARNRRVKMLHDIFGPEFDETVKKKGSQRAAIVELEARLKQSKSIELHPLTVADRDHYQSDWMATQAEFVEEPCKAVSDADKLIMEVMQCRGYPLADFNERVAELSVKYPQLVNPYRTARDESVDTEAHVRDTEELRQAMLRYKEVFNGLMVTEAVK